MTNKLGNFKPFFLNSMNINIQKIKLVYFIISIYSLNSRTFPVVLYDIGIFDSSKFHPIFSLVSLDVHGIEKKGFEVAQFIRHHNPYAIIVFITSRSEFATLTYKYQVSALDFVDKDINDELFKKRIEQNIFYTKSMLLENEDVVDYFDYNYKGNDLKIPYHDILYIETTGVSHKLRIIGKNFAKEFYGTMTDIQEKDKHTQRFLFSS